MDDAIYNLTYSDLTHKVDVDPKLEYDKLKVLNCYAQVFDDNIFECRISDRTDLTWMTDYPHA